jgi:hypothetical protein
MKKPTGKAKPGAQPSNKNAEKHGFYSKQFSKTETTQLKGIDLMSIESEIELINTMMNRLANFIPEKFTKAELEDHLKALNTLSIMMQSKSTMIRTHYLTRGKGGTIEQGIMDALEELRLELGL